MPFTPAHPAIVLPLLRKRWVSATGLIVGSLSPDFEYFFKLSVDGDHSHTIAGLFYFDLPVTLILAVLFHEIVKENFIHNLPAFLQRRLTDTLNFDFRRFLIGHWSVFLLSAFLGAASHVFWDAFTHGDGYFTMNLPRIYQITIPYQGGKYPMFYFLQHLSTCAGLIAVSLYVLAIQPAGTFVSKPRMVYWTLVMVIASLVVLLRLYLDDWTPGIGNLVVSMISGLCIAVIATGLIKFNRVTVNIVDGQEKSVGSSRKA